MRLKGKSMSRFIQLQISLEQSQRKRSVKEGRTANTFNRQFGRAILADLDLTRQGWDL